MSVFPRCAHQLYARWLGYFWLPCPVCGREFGGHETTDGPFSTVGKPGHPPHTSRMVCPRCVGSPETLAHAAEQDRWFRGDAS